MEYKTPSYQRKASKNYYEKMKSDPIKYKEYLLKIKERRQKKKQELKDNQNKILDLDNSSDSN